MMQVAFSLIVLFVGGLLVRSFVKLSSVNPGFEMSNVLLVSWEAVQRLEPNQQRAALLQVLDRLRDFPGVAAVSAAEFNVLGRPWRNDFPLPGTARETIEATMAPVTPGYFETMKIPLRRRTDLRPRRSRRRGSHRRHRQRIVREALLRWRAGGRPPVRCALGRGSLAERGRRRRRGCSLRPAQAAGADDLHPAPATEPPYPARPRVRRSEGRSPPGSAKKYAPPRRSCA